MKKVLLTVLLLILSSLVAFHGEFYSPEKIRSKSPVQMKKLTRGVVQYETSGEGSQAIVFIHGATIPMNIFDEQFSFFKSQHYQLLRYNQYGRGVSDYPRIDYSHKEYVETAIELFDSLGLDSVILVGHSFGAGVAAMIAVQNPERVSKIVLLDPSLDEITGNVGAKIERFPILGELLGSFMLPSALNKRAHTLLSTAGVSDSDQVYTVLAQQKKMRGFHHSVHKLFCGDALENRRVSYRQLDSLKKPVLLIQGKPKVASDRSTILAALPSSKKYYFENGCHLVHVEMADSVNKIISAFINEKMASKQF